MPEFGYELAGVKGIGEWSEGNVTSFTVIFRAPRFDSDNSIYRDTRMKGHI